jgi:ferredoxin/flavodoxin---NADP+ reductase
MSEWVQGRVVNNIRYPGELFVIQVDAPVQPFIAGQYTKLALDVDGERIARPYSMVNPPTDSVLEFYFNTVPDGDFTSHLSELKGGDNIWVSQTPSGFFTLEEVPDAEQLWLLATGTAIGPYISILKTDAPWERFSKIVLVHGVRHFSDLNYRQTIAELEERNPGKFIMVPFISREVNSHAMDGHIPDAIENGKLEQRVGLQLGPDKSQVMICGNLNMIRETQKVLDARGLNKNLRRKPGHVTTEHYWRDD